MVEKIDAAKDFRKSLGLVLVFIGMQFNTALKNVAIGMDISAVIMLLSALLLIDVNSLFRLRMSNATRILALIQLLLLLISLASNQGTTQLVTFHLYLLVITYALSTNKNYIQFKYFGKIFFWLSGLIAIVVLFQATNGFTRLNIAFDNTGKLWLSQGGDPITMSRALELNFIACLFYKEKNKIEKIIAWLFVAADIIGVFSFSNRSVVLCALLVFCIWYIRYFNQKFNAKKIAVTIFAIIVALFWGSKTAYFATKIDAIFNSMKSGVGTLLGANNVLIDSSAKTRIAILANMEIKFAENFLKNFLFGMGYNYTYVDRPIYQAYFDFGILGLALYSYFLLLVPVITIMKQLKKNMIYNGAWIFIVFSMIQNLVDQFLTGLPYYYYLWTPTVFVLFSISNYKLKNDKDGFS